MMKSTRSVRTASQLAVSALILSLAACSKPQEPAQQTGQASEAKAQEALQTSSEKKVLSMPRTPAPEGARVYFTNIKDGDTVSSPVTLQFGAENVGIVKAGVYEPATGHHHLLIDAELPSFDQVFPADSNHVHFGGGQLETTVELEPGTHTLQLLLGDGDHVPHNPPIMSERITITVE